jgi:hypothetical protein
MKIFSLHSAFAGATFVVSLLSTLPTSNAYGVLQSTAMTIGRRAFVAQGIVFTSAALTTTRGDAAVAVSVDVPAETGEKASRESKSKKEEAERKKAEKEARRIAEETKKKLAVGRIGTI